MAPPTSEPTSMPPKMTLPSTAKPYSSIPNSRIAGALNIVSTVISIPSAITMRLSMAKSRAWYHPRPAALILSSSVGRPLADMRLAALSLPPRRQRPAAETGLFGYSMQLFARCARGDCLASAALRTHPPALLHASQHPLNARPCLPSVEMIEGSRALQAEKQGKHTSLLAHKLYEGGQTAY